jgi:hypothetical protein
MHEKSNQRATEICELSILLTFAAEGVKRIPEREVDSVTRSKLGHRSRAPKAVGRASPYPPLPIHFPVSSLQLHRHRSP